MWEFYPFRNGRPVSDKPQITGLEPHQDMLSPERYLGIWLRYGIGNISHLSSFPGLAPRSHHLDTLVPLLIHGSCDVIPRRAMDFKKEGFLLSFMGWYQA